MFVSLATTSPLCTLQVCVIQPLRSSPKMSRSYAARYSNLFPSQVHSIELFSNVDAARCRCTELRIIKAYTVPTSILLGVISRTKKRLKATQSIQFSPNRRRISSLTGCRGPQSAVITSAVEAPRHYLPPCLFFSDKD